MSSKLNELISKLGNPSSDVCIRSAQSLATKLKVGLCSVEDLLNDLKFIPSVILLIKNDSLDVKLSGLNLLDYVLKVPRGKMNFDSAGGRLLLEELKSFVPSDLERRIEVTLNKSYKDSSLDYPSSISDSFIKFSDGSQESFDQALVNKISAKVSEPPPLNQFEELEDTFASSCVSLGKDRHPILISVLPWVHITEVDSRVLKAVGDQLEEGEDLNLFSTLQVIQSGLFEDFPAEVFLQRPRILVSLIHHLNKTKGGCGAINWRVQECVCKALSVFTKRLSKRIEFPEFRLVPQSSYLETVKDSLENADFPAQRDREMTVPRWCSQVLKVSIELLKSSRMRVMKILLALIRDSMRVLRSCISPVVLWDMVSMNSRDVNLTDARNISSSLLQCLNIISTSLVECYKYSRGPCSKDGVECSWMRIKVLILVFHYWIQLFCSEDAHRILGNKEREGIAYVLSDPFFNVERPEIYVEFLRILRRMDSKMAAQVEALGEASQMLSCTLKFLQRSSSEIDEFLDEASSSVPLLFCHKSQILVEKIVRGVAKQSTLDGCPDQQLTKGRDLILQLLSNPDKQSRNLGYAALKNLVTKNVGISEVNSNLKDASSKVLPVLHCSVINHIIFSGCSEKNSEIKEASRSILLTLIWGLEMMSASIASRAEQCFAECLLNLQTLVDSKTQLGNIIFNFPYVLYKRKKTSEMELRLVKFYLKCLLCRDKNVRQDALKSCLALLITLSSSEYVSVASSLNHFNDNADSLIFNPSMDVFTSQSPNPLDRSTLTKVLRLLWRTDLDASAIEAAWIQLSLLLQKDSLHFDLDERWPISDAIGAVKSMMKVSGEDNMSVSLVPIALEVLFLRAFSSAATRSALAKDLEFLLLLLRALVYFYANNDVQQSVSVLFSLILNVEIIEQRSSEGCSESSRISLPVLVSETQHIPFKHGNYSWKSNFFIPQAIRTLWGMSCSPANSVLPVQPEHYLKFIWSSICASNYKELLGKFDFASPFSKLFVLNDQERVILRSNLSISHAALMLLNIENATNHQTIKENIIALRTLLAVNANDPVKLIAILRLDNWEASINRFFLSAPSTAADKQILYHVLLLLDDVLIILRGLWKSKNECLRCLTIAQLVEAFSKPERVLASLLKESGTKEFLVFSTTAVCLQNFSLFSGLISIASRLVQFSPSWNCPCLQSSPPWPSFTSTLSSVLLSIVAKCKSTQECNIPILIPTLDCVIHLNENFPCLQDRALQWTPFLIELAMSLHVGRGRASNTFLGKAVSGRVLYILALCVSNAGDESTELVDVIRNELPSLPWLLASLEHCDPAIVAAAFRVAISLATIPSGSQLLDEECNRVSGGVWSLALSMFCNPECVPVVRVLALSLLCTLSAQVIRLPKEKQPLRSLCITNSETNRVSSGEDGLIAVLNFYNFFEAFGKLLRSLVSCEGRLDSQPHAKEFGISPLDDFVLSERSEWLSSDAVEEENENVFTWIQDFPEILTYSFQFIYNVFVISPSRIIREITTSGVGKLIIRQLCFLTERVKRDCGLSEMLESAFRLVRLMGVPFCRGTELAPLAVNAIAADYIPKLSLQLESFCLLTCMIEGGGWGAVRVLELLRSSPGPVVRSLVQFLHISNPDARSAILFVGSLCKIAAMENTTFYLTALQDFLDSALPLSSSKEEDASPGWEICRHLIQLLPSKTSRSLSSDYSPEAVANLKLILETLKLLLGLSRSARDCAYVGAADLLRVLAFSLSNLSQVVLEVNLHITTNMMNKKEIQFDLEFATHCLQVASNWISESVVESSDPDRAGPLVIAECLVPLLHPLWLPSLRAAPLIDAVIQFLIASTSHAAACPVLTRTTVIPGALLSHSRTKQSLMAVIANNVNHLLTKKNLSSGRCRDDCKNLSRDLLNDSLDLIMNCSRIHESAFVIVKENFVQSTFEYIDRCRSLSGDVVQKLVQCVAVLSLHKEARSAILKIPSWIKSLKNCFLLKNLTKNVNLVFVNMALNVPAVKNLLSSMEFLSFLVDYLRRISENITDGIDLAGNESELHSSLFVLWVLLSNNERPKAFLKRLPLKPTLEHFSDVGYHVELCQKIIKIGFS